MRVHKIGFQVGFDVAEFILSWSPSIGFYATHCIQQAVKWALIRSSMFSMGLNALVYMGRALLAIGFQVADNSPKCV